MIYKLFVKEMKEVNDNMRHIFKLLLTYVRTYLVSKYVSRETRHTSPISFTTFTTFILEGNINGRCRRPMA